MADRLKRRGKKKSHLDSPWAVLGLGALAFMMAHYAFTSYITHRNVAGEQSELTRDIDKRTESIHDLEKQLKRVKSGEGLELEARSRLNLRKPGEMVLIIVDDNESENKKSVEEKNGFWDRIKSWFNF